MKDLILIGPQGSGKGTQGKILAEKFGYQIFETGAELRKISKEDSELGRQIKATIEAGDLVSNDQVMAMVRNFVDQLEGGAVLFDGIPRSMEQRETLEQLLTEKNRDFMALEISVPEEVTFERLKLRAEQEGRADDNVDTIKRRLQNFYEFTAPILKVWKETGHLISVDGDQELEKVSADIFMAIEKI